MKTIQPPDCPECGAPAVDETRVEKTPSVSFVYFACAFGHRWPRIEAKLP